MNIFTAALLGLVQGLTEFLPVSSSGHLVLVQKILPNFAQPGVLFDVTLHLGTMAAILVFFRKTIFKLSTGYLWTIILGTVPAVVIGFLFRDLFVGFFENVVLVGFALIVTGILNYLTDKSKGTRSEVSNLDAIIIGIAQAIAIIPGISRSGSTIFTGTSRGIGKTKSATYSFLLSVPAVFGATMLEAVSNGNNDSVNLPAYAVGFIFAFVSGYFAIRMVFEFLKLTRFKYFSLYCIVVGLITILIAT